MTTGDIQIPTPVLDDDNRGFWEGCKRHELLLQKCSACGKFRYYPRPSCPYCVSMKYEWARVSGKGKVYSWVVVHPPTLPLFMDKVPYNVILVELAEGPRMVSNLVGARNEDIYIGMPVEVAFEPLSEDVTVPRFKPAPGAGKKR